MSEEWISPEANEEGYVRIGRLTEIDEGLAKFRIEDAYLEEPDIYERTIVGSGYVPEIGMPDRFYVKDVFLVVSPSEGEFAVSYDAGRYRDGSFTEDSPTVGLQYDEEFHRHYAEITSNWIEKTFDDDDTDREYGTEEHTSWDEL